MLAAQLFNELKSFFPHNAVEYFVSFYDFYLPESYSPTTDRFTDKVCFICCARIMFQTFVFDIWFVKCYFVNVVNEISDVPLNSLFFRLFYWGGRLFNVFIIQR